MGTGEGAQDAANELKGALARGEFPCIGATTHDEFRRFIQADPALERRFTAVVVREPSVAETVEILSGLLARYEADGANFLDGSGSLMSQDDRHRVFQLTFDDLQIGVTEPHCGNLDEHVGRQRDRPRLG